MYVPNEQLSYSGRLLVDRDNHWVKPEKNARSTFVVAQLASIVRNAVSVRMKWRRTWRDVGSRDHMERVPVCDKHKVSHLHEQAKIENIRS